MRKWTVIFIVSILLLIGAYDVFIISYSGKQDSISWVVIEWGHQYPVFTFLIGFAMDQYCYVAIRATPKLLGYHTKVTYSKTEFVEDNRDIKNNAVRGVLQFLGITTSVEISHMSDLPACS